MKRLLIVFLAAAMMSGCSSNVSTDAVIIENPIFVFNNKPTNYGVDKYANFNASVSVNDINWQTEMKTDYNRYDLTSVNSYENTKDIMFAQNGFLFDANQNYNISFNISSNTPKNIKVNVVDKDHDQILASKDYTINAEQLISIDFKSLNAMSFSGALEIYLGGQSIDNLNVTISNIQMHMTNDKYSVKVNQIGYPLYKEKYAIFSNYDGDYFNIYDNATDQLVYQGTIVNKRPDENSKEIVGYGDFSDFDEVGEYYIVSQYGTKSYPFEIKTDVYQDTLKDAFKMISIQRCGYELPMELYQQLAHPLCHDTWAKAYGFSHEVDAQGGWHDAGDYGRYVSTTAKTTIDLMMTYLLANEKFDDNMFILESNNGINDLLDEIRVGVDFLLKMQRNDGGIYHKVVTESFANFVSPEDDNGTLYALNVDSASTAFASAIFAMASQLYQGIDDELSLRCQQAAQLSYDFITNNDYIEAFEPEEFGNGHYRDGEADTEIFLMNMAFWYMTNDQKYADIANDIRLNTARFNLDVEFNNPSLYGAFLYAYLADDSDMKTEYSALLIGNADIYYDAVINDPYFVSLQNNYAWGSNAKVANHAMVMLLAYNLNNDYKYMEAAYHNVHYLLGRNATNYSFVTNNGDLTPQNIHHRFTVVNDVQLPGALVGGPNKYREDGLNFNNYNENTAPSKSYVDDANSYASNEVAIYYNSPLVFVLANLD